MSILEMVNKPKKIVTDVLVSTFVKAIVRVKGVILIPLISLTLGVDSYGAYVQVVSFSMFLGAISQLGLNMSLVKFAQKKDTNIGILYTSTTSLAFINGVIGAMIVILMSKRISVLLLNSPSYTKIFQIGSILIPVRILNKSLRNYFRSQQKVKTFSILQAIRSYLTIGSILFTTLVINSNLDVVMIGVVIVEILYVTLLQLFVFSRIGLKLPSYSVLRTCLAYSIPLVISILSDNLSERADRFIVGYFIGSSAVGAYTIAYRLAKVILIYVIPVRETYFPELSKLLEKNKIEDCKSYLRNGIRYFLMLSIPSVFGFRLVSESAISIISNQSAVNQASPILPVVAVGMILLGLNQLYGVVLVAEGLTTRLSSVRGSAAIINIILNLIIVPEYGIIGAALSTVLTYVISLGGVYWLSNKIVPSGFLTLNSLRISIASGVMFVFGVSLGIKNIFLLIPISAVVYSFSIVLLGELSISDIRSSLNGAFG